MEDEKQIMIMKKVVLFFTFSFSFLFPFHAFSQFSTWTPTENYQEVPVQQTYGYIRTSSGWMRISLRIKEGNYSVMVVGYKTIDKGPFTTWGGNQWKSTNSKAEVVSVYSDGQEIVRNFDYKANIPGLGTVYF